MPVYQSSFVSALSALAGLASVFGLAGVASAQTFVPQAFGPVPGDLGGRFVTSVRDISADGRVVTGQLSDFTSFASGPLGVTSLGFDTTMLLSNDGQTIVGQRFVSAASQPVVRWNLGSTARTDLPMQATQLRGMNSDATSFLLNGRLVNAAGVTTNAAPTPPGGVQPFFVLNTLASRAPIAAGGGGAENSGYRYNFSTGVFQSFQAVPGTTATLSGSLGQTISGDGSVVVGTSSVGGQNPQPTWWDVNGAAHLIAPQGGTGVGLASCVNDAGTLIGGNATNTASPTIDTAFVYSIALNQSFNVGQIYRDAGLMPAGFRLVATSHISDDGSRIFCSAIGPGNVSQVVMLTGVLNVPTPGAAALLGLSGLVAMRRRR